MNFSFDKVQDFSIFAVDMIEVMGYFLIFAVGIFIAWLLAIYLMDKIQTKSTLRRNYPVLARFRYIFEHLGEFFRQYFFAHDREEMPFNRAQRSWIYRAAKNVDSTVAFGSSKDLKIPGTIYFQNCAFPTMQKDALKPREVVIGENCKKPYKTAAFFHISGMSYGAISKPAVLALSKGAKMAGIWMNTGEGGLSKYHEEGGADIVFQIGTAKFGVRNADGSLSDTKLKELGKNKQVKMFEIKLSQGAKPGKGGILPGAKVTKEIAQIRGLKIGKDAISPNRHPEIDSMKALLDMINHIRDLTGKPVGFKAVIGTYEFIEDLCKEIKKRGAKSAPDFITIDSADGGTGAAPMSLIDNMGLPIKETLPITIDLLKKYRLRERIKICAGGKLVNPSDVAWALAVGADFVVSARGFMFALGCIQALQCNKNTCPTGITTHNKKLQNGLNPKHKAVRVMQYAQNMEKEVGIIARACGVREPRGLTRQDCRIVMPDRQSINMEKFYQDMLRKV